MYGQKPYQLLGWKSIRSGYYETFRCPACGRSIEILFEDGDAAQCYRCNHRQEMGTWPRAKFRRHFAVCAGCNTETPLTSSYSSAHYSWFCNECNNLITMKWQNQFISATDILKFEWAPSLQERAVAIGSGIRAAECTSKREHLITWLLFQWGREEDGAFLFGSFDEERKALLAMDDHGYVGYLFWSDKEPALRQIFVRKDRQRTGIGGAMIRYWAEHYVFSRTERFGVESPNEKSANLLVKLGYAEYQGEVIKLTRCYRVASF